MSPSQVHCIAFFYNNVVEDETDELFMRGLIYKEVTEALSRDEAEKLSTVYDKYAPHQDEYEHVRQMAKTLKDIEYLKIKFVSYKDEDSFDIQGVI